MEKQYFSRYFHEVLLNDEIYLDLCDKIAVDFFTELPLEDELKFQTMQLIKDNRELYIHKTCEKLYSRRN